MRLVAEAVLHSGELSTSCGTLGQHVWHPAPSLENTFTPVNPGDKPDITGGDDLLAAFGLSRLYEFAVKGPVTNPFAKLAASIDKSLHK